MNIEPQVAAQVAEAACPRAGARENGVSKPWDSRSPTSVAAAIICLIAQQPKVGWLPRSEGYVSLSACTTMWRDRYLSAGCFLPQASKHPDAAEVSTASGVAEVLACRAAAASLIQLCYFGPPSLQT